jgi:hypothetical protein
MAPHDAGAGRGIGEAEGEPADPLQAVEEVP